MMQLYTFAHSSTSYRVRIALNLKGLTPEMHDVNLTKGEQLTSEYAALNVQKNLPLLIDGDASLTQSLAIIEYLDETYPGPSLLPGDAAQRAHIRALSLLIAADISPLGNLKVRKYLQGPLAHTEETTITFINHWIADGFAKLESILACSPHTGTFCVGDTPTMADCCLVPQLHTARRWKLNLAPYPTILRIATVAEVHPAFIAAHPHNQSDGQPL